MADFFEEYKRGIESKETIIPDGAPQKKRKTWIIFMCAGIVLLFGAAAVSAKISANQKAEKQRQEVLKKEKANTSGVKKEDEDIIDFATCAKSYPVSETTPKTCKTSTGKIFTEEWVKTEEPSKNIKNETPSSPTATASPSSTPSSTPNSTPSPIPRSTSATGNQVSPTPSPVSQNQPEQATPTPVITLEKGSIFTPYVNESDISSVNEAYSLIADNPYWGFWHPGVDFMITKESIPVQASTGGTIENLAVEKSTGIMGWHVGFCINHGLNSVCYNLETFGSTDEIGNRQRDNIFVKNGDVVNQGQVIANLIFGGSGAHIDFGVTAPGTRVCPEPYFTEAARESVLRLIHIKQPTWPMCYEP